MSYRPWDSWESEYLTFEEDDHYEGKTKRLVVVSKSKLQILGEIKWYGPWRQYTFFPEEATIWNTRCLEDVQEVIKALMDERTQDKREREKALALTADFLDGKSCQYHPPIEEWPTENLESRICPTCGVLANLNEAMAARIIESRT